MNTGIQEIGCSNDGSVWFNLRLELDYKKTAETIAQFKDEDVKSIPLAATLTMTAEKAEELIAAIKTAVERGNQWLKTGVQP